MSRKRKRFEALVSEFSLMLYRYAYWMSQDKSQAEDLVQETFYRAWKSFNHLRDEASAKAWLITILRREHARLYAKQKVVLVDIQPLEAQLSGGEDPVKQAQCAELHAAIMRLDIQYREPMILQIISGLSGLEIAKQLGLNLNTVNLRLYRARQQLREHYQNIKGSPARMRLTS